MVLQVLSWGDKHPFLPRDLPFTSPPVPQLGRGHKGRLINPRKTSARIIELINNPAERKMHLVREQHRLPCKRGMSVTGEERERWGEVSAVASPTIVLWKKRQRVSKCFDDCLGPLWGRYSAWAKFGITVWLNFLVIHLRPMLLGKPM